MMISIIVPVYNVEKFIYRCIDSILNQTFKDFELILIDDGSPDRCPEICDNYAQIDDRIRVIHKNNGGLSSARNAGIDAATGSYIMFCDSDDFLHPQILELLLSACESYHVNIAMGLITRYSSESIPVYNQLSIEQIQYHFYTGIETQDLYFDINNAYQYVSACCKLYKKELFQTARFPIGRYFEDEYVTYQRMLASNKICVLNTTLYFYYINPTGITGTLSPKKQLDEFQAQYERSVFFRKNHYSDLYRKSLMEYLRSAQWTLIECKNNPNLKHELTVLQNQYHLIWKWAKTEKLLQMPLHFDYYVLANPHKIFIYRVWKFLGSLFQ